MVCWYCTKSIIRQALLFLSIKIRCRPLARIWWPDSIYISLRICVTYLKIFSGFCIYHLSVWCNISLLHNFLSINFPTKSCRSLYYDFFLAETFSLQCQLMVFDWNQSGSKFPKVSGTLLSILADLNNGVVRMVSTRPLISKWSSLRTKHLLTVPNGLSANVITNTSMIHCLFSSLARSWYLSLFSRSFRFTLWLARTTKSTLRHILFFYWLSLGVVVWPRLDDSFVSTNHKKNVRLILGRILDCAFSICPYVQI